MQYTTETLQDKYLSLIYYNFGSHSVTNKNFSFITYITLKMYNDILEKLINKKKNYLIIHAIQI